MNPGHHYQTAIQKGSCTRLPCKCIQLHPTHVDSKKSKGFILGTAYPNCLPIKEVATPDNNSYVFNHTEPRCYAHARFGVKGLKLCVGLSVLQAESKRCILNCPSKRCFFFLCPSKRCILKCPSKRCILRCPSKRCMLKCPFERCILKCPSKRCILKCPSKRCILKCPSERCISKCPIANVKPSRHKN